MPLLWDTEHGWFLLLQSRTSTRLFVCLFVCNLLNLNDKIESRPIKQINNAYTRRNGLENYWYEMIGLLNVGIEEEASEAQCG